ncbi:LysR family transcriptional regulator, repressor for citA [Butyrivibrio fibrisolvens DSM 3071]|uniref:LysR family transcriptional regulator, repressor for citA n=1 Tax=Butyrivibrio fibrisolvens DSM 3071 TaxID=1121131 RepID=A0A1M5PWB8_BUTFI|nr:LysR family transcriptional regulator [Butyrivibrio fibrisolvens]SHH05960.1 LysR family transcriptional regulator, repressor for citA [Butyrivibrio fibrisolvens DSM 3071]
MNKDQLLTFLSLVETKSFTRTSENLIVAQSTVSKRIQELEKEIGKELFVRNNRKLSITPAGITFLNYAEEIINLENIALEAIQQNEKFSHFLSVGTVDAFYELWLKKKLNSFANENPSFSIKIEINTSNQLITSIKKLRNDVIFSHHSYDNPNYNCKLIMQEDVLLVTSSENTKFKNGINSSKVKTLPMIHSDFLYSGTYQWLFPPAHRFQLSVNSAAKALPLLFGSAWYTILPRHLVNKYLSDGTLISIPILDGAIPPVDYYVIYPKKHHQDTAIKCFLDQILS